jgi:hypothetical protein
LVVEKKIAKNLGLIEIKLPNIQGILITQHRIFNFQTSYKIYRGITDKNVEIQTEFIRPSSLTTKQMMKLFDRVVLTPEEDVIIEALRKIEPDIDRIAPIASKQSFYSGF